MSSSFAVRLSRVMIVFVMFAVIVTPIAPGVVFASGPPEWIEMDPGETRQPGEDPARTQPGPPAWAQMQPGDRAGNARVPVGPPEHANTGRSPWSQNRPGDSADNGTEGSDDSKPAGDLAPWATETPVADEDDPSWPGRGLGRPDRGGFPGQVPSHARERMPEAVPAPWVHLKPEGQPDNRGRSNNARSNRPSRLFSGLSGLAGFGGLLAARGDAHSQNTELQRYSDIAEITSDDFNRLELGDLWSFQDPVGDSALEMNGTNAIISVPAGTSHDVWIDGVNAPRLMQPAPDTDFEIEAKFESLPFGINATQGLLVMADDQNLLRFDVYSSGESTYIFGATFQNGSPTVHLNQSIAQGLPILMRITRSGDFWTLAYSVNNENWQPVASYSHSMSVAEVGVFAGNAGSQPPAHTASIDYFFNTASPIDPVNADSSVDTAPPGIARLNHQVSGNQLQVTWITGKPSSSVVRYGTDSNLSDGVVEDPGPRYLHSITVSDLQQLTTYHFQVESTGLNGATSVSPTSNVRSGPIYEGSPVIDVWYGNEQSFGSNGTPQRWINVTGNVWSPDGIASLTYSLNGGDFRPLTVGANADRLVSSGDFNIELDRWSLNDGPNTVVITAVDNNSVMTDRTVTVNYSDGTVWPLPYEIDWSSASSINDVAQVIDGLWTLTGDGVRPVEIGYDRLIGIGDVTWDDFEIVAPITIHDFGNTFPPAVGLGARWAGHYPHDDSGDVPQPRWEWRPLGGIGWYEWSHSLNCFRLNILGDTHPLVEDESCRQLEVGTTYTFKFRVETIDSNSSRYRLKVWKDGEPEPADWDLSAIKTGHLHAGSMLLVAHDLDATFGNIAITPLSDSSDPGTPPGEDPPESPITSDDFNSGTELSDVWTFVDPVGDSSLSLDGLHANIAVPAGTDHDVWTNGLRAPQLLQTVPDTDFDIATKFATRPQGTHALQGLIVKADDQNFVRFDYFSTGNDLNLFAATFSNGVPVVRINQSIPDADASDLYLRILRVGSQWTLSYSLNGQDWTEAADFGFNIGVSQVGVFVGNAGGSPPAFSGAIDYFFNMADPIDPYNANPPPTVEPSTIKSDDFNSGTDLGEFWTFVDPVGDSNLTLDGLHARIGVPMGTDHDMWLSGANAPRLMQATNDTDFGIEARFASVPSGTHALQGLVVMDEAGNFLRFDYFSASNNVNLFSAAVMGGGASVLVNQPIQPDGELSLRIVRTGNDWDLQHSTGGSNWQSAASFSLPMTVSHVGVFAGNATPDFPAFTGVVDYFFNTAEPIEPINANQPEPPPQSPASTLQSDDFSGETVADHWVLVDPLGTAELLQSDNSLKFGVPEGISHDFWVTDNNAPKLLQATNDTDLDVSTAFESIPVGTHALQGMVIQSSEGVEVRFDVYSAGDNLNVFGAVLSPTGSATVHANQAFTASGSVNLRIRRVQDKWTLFAGADGSAWTQIAEFDLPITVTHVGVFVGNAPPSMPAFTAQIDSFVSNPVH